MGRLVVIGTFALAQTSRLSGGVTGVANLTAMTNVEVLPVVTNYPINATLTTGGTLSFVLMDMMANTWNFTGTVAGNTVNGGRHTIVASTGSYSGDWSATRTSTVAPRTAETASAGADLQNVLRALR